MGATFWTPGHHASHVRPQTVQHHESALVTGTRLTPMPHQFVLTRPSKRPHQLYTARVRDVGGQDSPAAAWHGIGDRVDSVPVHPGQTTASSGGGVTSNGYVLPANTSLPTYMHCFQHPAVLPSAPTPTLPSPLYMFSGVSYVDGSKHGEVSPGISLVPSVDAQFPSSPPLSTNFEHSPTRITALPQNYDCGGATPHSGQADVDRDVEQPIVHGETRDPRLFHRSGPTPATTGPQEHDTPITRSKRPKRGSVRPVVGVESSPRAASRATKPVMVTTRNVTFIRRAKTKYDCRRCGQPKREHVCPNPRPAKADA